MLSLRHLHSHPGFIGPQSAANDELLCHTDHLVAHTVATALLLLMFATFLLTLL